MESRINHIERVDSQTVLKKAGKVFRRGLLFFNPKRLLQKEIEILEKLQPSPFFPKVLSKDKHSFTMSYGGERVTKDNLPADWETQIETISEVLEAKGVVHRDIKPSNLLVLDGRLMLIDFGWAYFNSDKPHLCSRDLIPEIPKRLIYDNRFALQEAIREVLNHA